MTNKFSHFPDDSQTRYGRFQFKTLCGRYVDVMSLHFTKYINDAPLCPKCAARKLIAETQVTA